MKGDGGKMNYNYEPYTESFAVFPTANGCVIAAKKGLLSLTAARRIRAKAAGMTAFAAIETMPVG